MKRTLAVVALALCLAVPIAAQEWRWLPFPTTSYTVKQLMDACDAHEHYPASLVGNYEGFCQGYLAASIDWIEERERGNQPLRWVVISREESMICTSLDGKTMGQIIAVFLKWGKEHPELWDKDRRVGVDAAISEAWPCEQPSENTDKP